MSKNNKIIIRKNLDIFLQDLLQPNLFQDYCPNGLQVEGADHIHKVIFGVTACKALIDRAVALNAQAIIAHHGYFWRGEKEALVGMKGARVKQLMKHDINLFAYHLPLDCHPELGNNVQLAELLDFPIQGWLKGEGLTGLGLWGELNEPCSGEAMQQCLQQKLNRSVTHVAPDDRPIRRIGWCTGGAQSYIEKAAELDLDAYISGEISEATVHSARENGLHYFAAGHHATERGGVKALAQYLFDKLGLDCEFVDIDSPA